MLVYTPGEPAGIGPDLAIELAWSEHPAAVAVIADPKLLRARAKKLLKPVVITEITPEEVTQRDPLVHFTGQKQLLCIPVKLHAQVKIGKLNPLNAAYVLETLSLAVSLCTAKNSREHIHGMVTGPVHKGVINQAGITFSGHTEFLAAQSNTPLVVMMLATAGLRVALATTHLPLKSVSEAINQDKLITIIHIIQQDLQSAFKLPDPHIYVCGLNPHAGEGGHLGDEEITTIIPAIEHCRHQGINVDGPMPADTVFNEKYLQKTDAVLAMYHDQGLPVLKYKGFGQAVNITLGLPFIRTSVDHGTALELAGIPGAINTGSLLYAIETAMEMSRNKYGSA